MMSSAQAMQWARWHLNIIMNAFSLKLATCFWVNMRGNNKKSSVSTLALRYWLKRKPHWKQNISKSSLNLTPKVMNKISKQQNYHKEYSIIPKIKISEDLGVKNLRFIWHFFGNKISLTHINKNINRVGPIGRMILLVKVKIAIIDGSLFLCRT